MNKFLVKVLFAAIGTGIAVLVGLAVSGSVSNSTAILIAVVTGRCAYITEDAITQTIYKS